ncbi:DsbA family protein [Halomicrococcus sp. NG-SE-24]|uniref:DsbA family protein n=1 Tax=Halomicrococcus sp. NG-SE-24 TaxID=3436928 RepID=UPI003D963138
MGRNETRRQFLRLTGGAALFGFTGTASANDATDPVSTAPVPGEPGQFTYATMGEGSNPTATLYGNFKCPYTKEFVLGNLEAVVEEFVEPGKLDLRYRALAYEPPGQSSHGSSYYYISDSDPRISECAMGAWDLAPDDYWAFFRDMFESQVSGTVTYDEMRSRMNDSDVDHRWGAISRAKDSDYEDPVYQTRYAAGDVGVTFTPTLALDGATTAPRHPGAFGLDRRPSTRRRYRNDQQLARRVRDEDRPTGPRLGVARPVAVAVVRRAGRDSEVDHLRRTGPGPRPPALGR